MEIKAVGRTRDRKGRVVKRTLKDYVNCLHGSLEGGTMGCFVAVLTTDAPNEKTITMEGKQYFIRKLTPREAFRLMGVRNQDIDKIQQAGICKTRQYGLAGNSIVVNVMSHIFYSLFYNFHESSCILRSTQLKKTRDRTSESHVNKGFNMTGKALNELFK